MSKVKQGLVRTSKDEQGLVGLRANPFYSVLIREKGFTILEAMIALVILAIALLALLRVLPVGLKGGKLAEATTIATMLAQRKIEEMRADTWSTLSNDSGDFTDENYPNFDYVITITSPETSLKGVTVSIYWPHDTTDHCVGIKTYIADHI